MNFLTSVSQNGCSLASSLTIQRNLHPQLFVAMYKITEPRMEEGGLYEYEARTEENIGWG